MLFLIRAVDSSRKFADSGFHIIKKDVELDFDSIDL